MHHWGFKQLEVGLGYKIVREPENPKDCNAIAVSHDGRKMAYLKKDNAFIISRLMKMGLSNIWRLKPKDDAVVKDKRTGPQQLCTVGFKVDDNANLKPAKDLLNLYCIQYEIKQAEK